MRNTGFIVGLLAGSALSVSAWGCGHTTDPAVPCEAMPLGEAAAGTVAAHADAPVLAFSDAPRPYVVHPVCRDSGCRLVRTYLEGDPKDVIPGRGGDGTDTGLAPESPILLTSSGRYVVAIDDGGTFRSWRIDAWADPPVVAEANRPAPGPTVLVSSLRNSDTVIVRNDALELGVVDAASGTFVPIAEGRAELKVVAVGHHYVVAREILDGESDRLHLVPVDPDSPSRFAGPIEIGTLKSMSRVEITTDDEFVVVTADGGDGDETFVFSIPDGELADRFTGAAVPGAGRLDALPGLRATSPDGTQLAYRTDSGALALRDLQAGTSCLIRSASGGDHTIAGFTADAMLYMQADFDLGASHVFAFDTATRTLSALASSAKGHHLVGAPPRLADRSRPWAIGVRQGSYAALHEDAPATSLGLQGPVFIPRSDDVSSLWLADKYEDAENRTRVGLRRFAPDDEGRSYAFSAAGDAQSVPEIFGSTEGGQPLAPGLSRVLPGERPCLATGAPGGWGYQCDGDGAREGFMAAAPMPASETTNSRDPQVEDP